jgi:hypothetical protein
MSDREPIRRVDWDAIKSLMTKILEHEHVPEPKPQPKRDYSVLRLTMYDLKFLYDIGVSCE